MKQKNKKILSYIITTAIVATAAVWIGGKFIHLGNVEFTDNAQVQRQIVPVNSRVQGYIKEIRFKEYEKVRKGDTLVIIDDADMRLNVARAAADYQNALAACYLAWFYFFIDYGVEKEALFLPLFLRGMASVTLSIVFLTSIVQSGLPLQVFPQALTINGFTGAVMSATLGPAIIGELLTRIMARNASLLGANVTALNPDMTFTSIGQYYGMVQTQALVVSMKEIYGWLLMVSLAALLTILISYGNVRPFAIFPKCSTVRRSIRHAVRTAKTS